MAEALQLMPGSRLREELEGHRASLVDRERENRQLRTDVDAIETDYRRRIEASDQRADELAADLQGRQAKPAATRLKPEGAKSEAKMIGKISAVWSLPMTRKIKPARKTVEITLTIFSQTKRRSLNFMKASKVPLLAAIASNDS